ncbi:MAG: hypothetical protein FIA97_19770 [Methylococcaceae bacterium]|nr:hypothetical protein [Methylococcaceae bacterium]
MNQILGGSLSRAAVLGLLWLALGTATASAASGPNGGQNQVTFWVIFAEKPDLKPAMAIANRLARGQAVIGRLKNTAAVSQAAVRSLLASRGVSVRSFWIANTLRVTGDPALMQELAARPDVARVIPDGSLQISQPTPGQAQQKAQALEWNIARVKAGEVWSGFGSTGEGVVIANVDTGVEYTHATLVDKYRGNLGGGSFDHNYNWYDPSSICGIPSNVPCDNAGHGTHTMGTMVGDDGTNQIGVAPGARWIAAKGCEDFGCSFSALLASGEWILAPTDLAGNNPDPGKRPDIVNNSWGGGPGDPFYQAIVDAWVAAGIFPAFSNGNAGPYCSSAGSPGDYAASYSAGASDINDSIAGFSSRGPSLFDGGVKPDIAAPGVDVRSAFPGNGFYVWSGTSMASPHVAGTVALLWSLAPALKGDVATTRGVLDQSAINVFDDSCGGINDPVSGTFDNNVWGEGRLDALAAATVALQYSAHGTVAGVVRDAVSATPVAGAKLQFSGPANRTIISDAGGAYSVVLIPGSYDLRVTAFGYLPGTVSAIDVADGSNLTRDVALQPSPRYAVSGTVVDETNAPVAGAQVSLLGVPIAPVTTDAAGAFRFPAVPEGEYDAQVDAGGCFDKPVQHLIVAGADQTVPFSASHRSDGFGYGCRYTDFGYIDGTDLLPIYDVWSSAAVALPFPFNFYGNDYSTAYVSANGSINFLLDYPWGYNYPIPDPNWPNAGIYPFWDELWLDPSRAGVYTRLDGTAPNRRFVIEWRNLDLRADFYQGQQTGLKFEVVLQEDGNIFMQYATANTADGALGNSASAGIEDETGSFGLQYAYNQPVLHQGLAVLYLKPPLGWVQGTISDANDGRPLAGASIRVLQNGMDVRTSVSDRDGHYRLILRPGDYQLQISAPNYDVRMDTVSVANGMTETRDHALATGLAQVSPSSLEFVLPAGQSRSRTLTLANAGTTELAWQIAETGGAKIQVDSFAGLQRNPAYDPDAPTTRDYFLGSAPKGWSPTAPGNVLASWPTTGVEWVYGVGYTGRVWLSDMTANGICGADCSNREFDAQGAATGLAWNTPWAGEWAADMAYDSTHGLVCQVNVGGDNGIHCWNPANGQQMAAITGGFPWTAVSQRGLAYRADDDSFYVGGWNSWPGVIYHIKGLSHADKGAVIGQCSPPDNATSGLGWDPVQRVLWQATNSWSSSVYQLNPDSCGVLAVLPHPDPAPWYNGGGLEVDADGNLWTISQGSHTAYLIESLVPPAQDVSWLAETPETGGLAVGASRMITVSVDTTGLAPGVYSSALYLQSNSGRRPLLRIPVSLVVSSYIQAVNAGGKTFTDQIGDPWAADRLYAAGGWGHLLKSTKAVSTRSGISGTVDDGLYQSARSGGDEYRYDKLPMGIYQIDLKFAEIEGKKPFKRLYDVIVEDALLLPAHDIAADAGLNAADDHRFYVAVLDGQLRVRFIPRSGFGQPLVNAIRVTHRPDR